MAKDPAFLFYPNDWLGGTMGMTFEEKGAYMDLLMMQFNRGHMTEHMIGLTVGQLWVNIKDKFKIDDDGKFYNERLEIEQIKRKRFTDSRKNNKSGKNQYSKNKGHMTKHMENENENENVVKAINIPFDDFWNLYDKKRGDRKKLKIKWDSLKPEERQSAIDYIPKYKEATQDKQYRKDPSTFLNNKSWNDEIINKNNGRTQEDKKNSTNGHEFKTIRYNEEANNAE